MSTFIINVCFFITNQISMPILYITCPLSALLPTTDWSRTSTWTWQFHGVGGSSKTRTFLEDNKIDHCWWFRRNFVTAFISQKTRMTVTGLYQMWLRISKTKLGLTVVIKYINLRETETRTDWCNCHTNYLAMPKMHSLNELWQTLSMCYNRSYLRNLICHIHRDRKKTAPLNMSK